MTGGDGLWKLTTDALVLSGPLVLRLYDSALGDITPDGGFTDSAVSVVSTFLSESSLASSGSGLTVVGNSVSNANLIPFNSTGVVRSIGSYAVIRANESDPSDALLFYWNLFNPLVVASNDSLQVAIGDLSFQLL
jgi:hypothetical protein